MIESSKSNNSDVTALKSINKGVLLNMFYFALLFDV